jgi:phosphate transport system substrate-binding protein
MTASLNRRTLMAGAAAFLSATPTLVRAQDVLGGGNAVTGAGSTFAYPILSRWAQGYRQFIAGGGEFPIAGAGLDDAPTAPAIDYEPVGSMAGILRAKEAAVDFGASDMPMPSKELSKLGLVQFPIVIGGVAVVMNVAGIAPGQLKLNGTVLSRIFLGKIPAWSDPEIAALNPGLKLPNEKIVIVTRADGSGTTFNFTNYLGKVSRQFFDTVGSDLYVRWPSSITARGNQGVAQLVAATPNAIGYVELAQAVRSKLAYALIENPAGQFIRPEPASFQAAASSAEWSKAPDFDLMLTNAPGDASYPITATVFVLMNKGLSQGRARGAFNFFRWSLDKGAADATALGYVPLPDTLVKQVKAYWIGNFKAAAT